MTRLLVSVRNAAEAQIALDAGVDLIDVKEPHHGSLGAADAQVISEVLKTVAGRVPVSVALGELSEPSTREGSILTGAAYAKIGLANCAQTEDWPRRWEQYLSQLPRKTARVAVVYADSQAASAPQWNTVLSYAARLGCAAVLLDTWTKNSGSVLSHWSSERIRTFILGVQEKQMLAVVGGGLTLEGLDPILAACPDFIAVRGAVCDGDRRGNICPEKIIALQTRLALVSQPSPSREVPPSLRARSVPSVA